MLDAIDTHSLTDNTLVIYLYDHGGRHLVDSGPLFNGFANLWEGGIRIPLLLRYPGRACPKASRRRCRGSLWILPPPSCRRPVWPKETKGLDGIDLLPILGGDIIAT